jgi:hypothetical protein
MREKIIVLLIGIVFLFSVSFASADFWSCFNDGQVIDFCNPQINDRTCGSTLCKYCMNNYDEGQDCYSPGNFNQCNAGGGDCSLGSGGIDSNPPEFTLNNPMQEGLYTERRVIVDFNINEEADVYFTDLLDGRGRWTRICNDCTSGSRSRSFDEGSNHIQFRIKDVVGNEMLHEVEFFVDSKEPRIRRTSPRRGFASGFFEVQFSELNPEKLELHYGNFITGMRVYELDIVSDCVLDRKKYFCDASVDVDDFDGEVIEYWFTLEDIAGNVDDSRIYDLGVDTTFPVVNSIETEVDGSRFYVTLDITELNFDEVEYIDNSASRPRWRMLCSRLRDGVCEKRISLRDEGIHNIGLQVVDDAGNMISESFDVEIV